MATMPVICRSHLACRQAYRESGLGATAPVLQEAGRHPINPHPNSLPSFLGVILMNMKSFSLAMIATAAFALPALAHHSFSMFDAEKTVTLNGTVKELEWTNPHSWLRVMVEDETTHQP